LTGQNAFSW